MLEILYIDEDLVAVVKPAGLLVHPTPLATDRQTGMSILRNQLKAHVFPVHRLDRATAGVLVFARHSAAAKVLCAQFAAGTVRKTYFAIVRGYFDQTCTTIDWPLTEQDSAQGLAVAAVTHTKRLATAEWPIALGGFPTVRYSLVEALPVTGRFHQIRKHLKHVSHPIVGDSVYGDGRHNKILRENFEVEGLQLWARSIELAHPRTGERLTVNAPPAAGFQNLCERFCWTDHLPARQESGSAEG